MKIFFDTNVLISAFLWKGTCFALMKLVLRNHNLVVCEPVILETKRILENKFKLPPMKIKRIESFLEKYKDESKLLGSLEFPKVRDKDDTKILESAIASKSDFLITGDKDLLTLSKEVNQIVIISPNDFLNKI